MGRLQNKSNIRRAGETAAFQTYTEDTNMAEYLDVIDDNGNLTGEMVAREVAHRDGIRHRIIPFVAASEKRWRASDSASKTFCR